MLDMTCDALASPIETPVQNPEPSSDRLLNGRFAPGHAPSSRGRPRGSRNKSTIAIEQLMDGEAEAITGKVIALALSGEFKAQKLCLEHIIARPKERPIDLELPPINTLADVHAAFSMVIAAMACGEIETHQAKRVADLLELKRKSLESVDLDKRLNKLEAQVAKAKAAGFKV